MYSSKSDMVAMATLSPADQESRLGEEFSCH